MVLCDYRALPSAVQLTPTLLMCGPTSTGVGLSWVSRAYVGQRWLLWAAVGLHWPVLAVVGLRWPALAHAHIWQLQCIVSHGLPKTYNVAYYTVLPGPVDFHRAHCMQQAHTHRTYIVSSETVPPGPLEAIHRGFMSRAPARDVAREGVLSFTVNTNGCYLNGFYNSPNFARPGPQNRR